jgi:aldose 1-epimerase
MNAPSQAIEQRPFGTTPDGQGVETFRLQNSHGSWVKIMTYGGIVTHFVVPDRSGALGDVVLGFDHFDDYLSEAYRQAGPYFGALIGRFGNRIAQAAFTLEGKTHQLAANNGPNSLHGGHKGFDQVVWTVKAAGISPDGPRLELQYRSPDGEEGYPGTLEVTAVYTFSDDHALRLDFTATTDQTTVVNLTQHSYFNLRGRGDITEHVVQIHGDHIIPVTPLLIPTGQLMPVEGTPFDFRQPTPIGPGLATPHEQLTYAGGYDHNWVLNKAYGLLAPIATVTEPDSGRLLEVSTTEPGVQFYVGNFLNGTLTGKEGRAYQFRSGFCLEPQHFPDSPNQPDFPSTLLRPGEVYSNTIIYRVGVAD